MLFVCFCFLFCGSLVRSFVRSFVRLFVCLFFFFQRLSDQFLVWAAFGCALLHDQLASQFGHSFFNNSVQTE